MADMRHLSGVDMMNKRVGILVTPELCTGCRGCQSACKEWKKLPAEETKNTGTYENPPDLSASTYNRIRFIEKFDGGKGWLFASQRCMHCGDAGCIKICPVPGALYRTKEGAVAFDQSKCIGCKLCRAGCPFDIPRYEEKADKIAKCDLCDERIQNGLAPACTKTCPTGALSFGEREALVGRANKSGYNVVYGATELGGMGVMFAFKHSPSDYAYSNSPGMPPGVAFWRTILRPLAIAGLGAAVAGTALHYLSVGPQDGEGGDQ